MTLRDMTPTSTPALPVKDVVTCLEIAYAQTMEHIRFNGDSVLESPGLIVTQPHVSITVTVADTPGILANQRITWNELEEIWRAVGPAIARDGYRRSEFLYKRTGKGPWLGWVRVKGEGSWG